MELHTLRWSLLMSLPLAMTPFSGYPYRNSNVMYEVGLALACRQSTEVLLVRDDHDRFLFDVSTIPHATINFTDKTKAIQILQGELIARLNERNFINDARVELAIASLSMEEATVLKKFADLPITAGWGIESNKIHLIYMASIPRLLDKHLIKVEGEFEGGSLVYVLTPLGRVVAQHVKSGLKNLRQKYKRIQKVQSMKIIKIAYDVRSIPPRVNRYT